MRLACGIEVGEERLDLLQFAQAVDLGRPRATQVYGLRELEQIEPFLADLYAACKAQGLPARTASSEYAPGQVEITLDHGDALVAMDQAIRYKRLSLIH
ncbi:hypothetical protein ACV34S_35390, partial [Pseudomonas aeruginosa]